MEKIKAKDASYIEESYWSEFTIKDLEGHQGIKIKNSANTCFLNRYNPDDRDNYWAECKMVHGNVKELRVLTPEELLKILNEDKQNYILVK